MTPRRGTWPATARGTARSPPWTNRPPTCRTRCCAGRSARRSDEGPEQPVRAAGAVLWRPAGAGIEVAVVHRPQYDDWSLPKGRLEHDEHALVAGGREVLEETGYHARPQGPLLDVSYTL